MSAFWDKYLLIITTTKDILLDPFGFADQIQDNSEGTKRAATYLGEGVILAFLIFQFANRNNGTRNAFSDLPMPAEILAAVMIAATMMAGLITHPVARWMSGSSTSVHASLSSYLYWTGFALFAVTPIFAVLIVVTQWLFAALDIGDSAQMFIVLAIAVPMIFVYYIGTISTWIGKSYDMEPLQGAAAVAIAYAASSGIGTLLAAAVAALTQTPAPG